MHCIKNNPETNLLTGEFLVSEPHVSKMANINFQHLSLIYSINVLLKAKVQKSKNTERKFNFLSEKFSSEKVCQGQYMTLCLI